MSNVNLLLAFTLPKHDGSVSKPNVKKVAILTAKSLGAAGSAKAGMGTLFGYALELTLRASQLILAGMPEEHFDAAKTQLVQQSQVLTELLKNTTKQHVNQDFESWQASLQSMAKLPAGAASELAGAQEVAVTVAASAPEANENAEQVEEKINDLMAAFDNIPTEKKKVN